MGRLLAFVGNVRSLKPHGRKQQRRQRLDRRRQKVAASQELVSLPMQELKLKLKILNNPRTAACGAFFLARKTFARRSLSFKSPLNGEAISVFFSQSFIASSIQLRWYGLRQSGVS
jgi:hypothetical protein